MHKNNYIYIMFEDLRQFAEILMDEDESLADTLSDE